MPAVYVSLPLTGPMAAAGRRLLRGVQLAHEAAADPPELVVLDSFAEDRDARAMENAHAAAGDPRALAYIGDFHSSQVDQAARVLGAAGVLQIAPVATWVGLGGPSLVLLTPDDRAGAHAIARWLVDHEVADLLLVFDHDDDYGRPVGSMCVDAARQRGVTVRARPVWDWDETPADGLDGAQAVLYVGVAGSGSAGMWHLLHEANPALWLLGSDGVAQEHLAGGLSPGAAARSRFFTGARASFDLYGYEALALALDAIAAGGGDREQITRAARATRDRSSVIGEYSLDDDGRTTTSAYGELAVVGSRLVWA